MNKYIALLCCVLLAPNTSVTAAQASLTLDQALIRVLENNPKLKVADYQARAMAARMRQALQVPATRINLNLENFGGSGEATAARGVEATLSLSRTLELGNKAARRGEVVAGEALLLTNQNDIDRLHLLADTAQRFLHVAADQERLRLAEEAVELVRLTERTVEERIRAGRTPAAERRRVVIDRANYDLELEHIRHELESSRVNLSTLWNDRQPDYDRVEADLIQLEVLPDFQNLTELLDRNPELTRHINAQDLARTKIRLMQGRRKPDIDLSAGLKYLGGSNDAALMLWASVPLGSAVRAQPGIDEASALSHIDPLNYEQKKLELYATLFEIYQEIKHAKEAVETLNERIIPAAASMLTDYEDGYQTVRYSLLELIQVQQLLRDARSQLVEMATSFHSHRIELDRLTGAKLTQW